MAGAQKQPKRALLSARLGTDPVAEQPKQKRRRRFASLLNSPSRETSTRGGAARHSVFAVVSVVRGRSCARAENGDSDRGRGCRRAKIACRPVITRKPSCLISRAIGRRRTVYRFWLEARRDEREGTLQHARLNSVGYRQLQLYWLQRPRSCYRRPGRHKKVEGGLTCPKDFGPLIT